MWDAMVSDGVRAFLDTSSETFRGVGVVYNTPYRAEAFWEVFGTQVGASWPKTASKSMLKSDFGRSWGILGRSWGVLARSWRYLGALGAFGRILERLGAILGRSWSVLARFWWPRGCPKGGMLGAFWQENAHQIAPENEWQKTLDFGPDFGGFGRGHQPKKRALALDSRSFSGIRLVRSNIDFSSTFGSILGGFWHPSWLKLGKNTSKIDVGKVIEF